MSRTTQNSLFSKNFLVGNNLNSSFLNHLKPPLQSAATATTKTFNAVINRLSSQGSHHEVLSTYSSMLKTNTPPDTYTFPDLLKACTSLYLSLYGLSFHQCIVVNGFSLDAYIASSLINFYAKFGHAQNARKVFDVMPHRNFVPWTSIIGCYSRAGNVGIAFEMFSEIRREEVQPSSVTLVSLISGVSELVYLQCLHGCAVLYGFESGITLANSMLNVYGKCGRVEDDRDLFEYMNARDIVSWNSLISSYSQAGNIGEVLRLLYTMRVEEMEPDKQTYASAVSVAATQSNLKLGMHGQILRTGYELDSHVETALMVMHLKCRNIDLAFHIFEGTTNKDVVLWTAMMSRLVQNDSADRALIVFSQMLESRTAPSSATIASALAACAQLGSFDMGTSVHGYVLRQGMRLDIPALNSLVTMYAKCARLEQSRAVFERMGIVDLLSRAGRVEEAYDCYKRVFPEPAVDVLGILLDACRTKGNEELGSIIAGEILMLRPGDAGNYVQLAHSYASTNRWDGVGEAWRQMRSHGSKKLSGWSSVELHGTITTFSTDHNANPQFDDIVSILKLLSKGTRKPNIDNES